MMDLRFILPLYLVSASLVAHASNELTDVVVESSEDLTEMDEQTEKLFDMAGTGGDPLNSLQSLPGITSDSRMGGEPSIRGSGPEANFYSIDGIQIPYLNHLFGYSVFLEETVQKFDIHTGAFPAAYGGATAGVIDVALRQPKAQDIKTNLHFGMATLGGFIEGEWVEGHPFYLGYRESTVSFFALPVARLFLTEEEEKGLPRIFPTSYDVIGRYMPINNDRHKLTVSNLAAFELIDFSIEDYSYSQQDYDPQTNDWLGETEIKTEYLEKHYTGFNNSYLDWQYNPNGDTEINNRIYYQVSGDYVSQGYQYKEGEYNYSLDLSHKLGWMSSVDMILNDQHDLKVGLEGHISKTDLKLIESGYTLCNQLYTLGEADWDCFNNLPPSISHIDHAWIGQLDVFAEHRWWLTPDLSLRSGVRYSEDSQIKDAKLQPRLRLEYQDLDGLSGFIALGRHTQMPQYHQLSPVFGNPKVNYASSWHAVAGMGKEFFSGWRLYSELYYKYTHGELRNYDEMFIADHFENIGLDPLVPYDYPERYDSTGYGLELLIEKEKMDAFSGWLSLSLSSTETVDETGYRYRADYDRPVVLDLVANYHLNSAWTFGLKFNIKSGKVFTDGGNVPYYPQCYYNGCSVSYSDGDVFNVTDLYGNNIEILYDEEGVAIDPYAEYFVYADKNTERTRLHHGLDARIEYTKRWPDKTFSAYLDIFNIYNSYNPRKQPKGEEHLYEDYSDPIDFIPFVFPLLGMSYEF